MDGVLCDFLKSYNHYRELYSSQPYPQSQYGFFLNLEPIDGAIDAMCILADKYDVWILTRPSVNNVMCYSEKAQWIKNHLGFDMQVKTIICTDKSLLKGDLLIDDQTCHGQSEFEGRHLHFATEDYPDWKSILNELV